MRAVLPRVAAALVVLAQAGCEMLFPLEPDPAAPDAVRRDGATVDGAAVDADACGMFDEDADGIRDRCDGCPTTPPQGRDTDGDGLDAGCDPRPDLPDRIVAFSGFNTTLADDGWMTIYGTPGVTIAGGSLRIDSAGESVIALPGTLPTAYHVEIRAAYATPAGKLAVFNDVNVGPANVGNGRWCYLHTATMAPESVLGWELLSDGEAIDGQASTTPVPPVGQRFTLGATRSTDGIVGCRYQGAQIFLTAPPPEVHHGPALYFLAGSFQIDYLIFYEHM
jgi:hypothetical protein